jgi:protease-4
MLLSNDTFSALLDMKSRMKKWRFLAILFIIIALISFNIKNFDDKDGEESLIEITENCIGNIEISGVLLKDKYRANILKEIEKEDRIKALIVNIDSPGGGVVESEIIYSLLRDISNKKPIVVVIGSSGASGGYMISLASDYIIAKNGSITGSIGVLMQSFEATDLAEKVGVKFKTYKSSELKGSPSPLEKYNPKVDKVIQESVDDIYKFFVELVAKRRGFSMEEAYKVSNGQIYTGRQALKLKLIDEIGGEKEALSYLKVKGIDVEELEIEEIKLTKPLGEFDFLDKFLGLLSKGKKDFLLKKNHLMFM